MTAITTNKVPITLGLMTWGEAGKGDSRVTEVAECERMLDLFLSYGHKEVDTAYVYNLGTSEEYLGKSRGVIVDTKLYPRLHLGISHSAADLRKFIEIELQALKTDCVDMWYLHGPDRSTPFAETMETVNELYKEGKFRRFGISNFTSWEVAQVCTLCEARGWIKPTAYQGIYNGVHRLIEPELLPCLRKFGVSFYAFNPLGGGFFTGGYSRDQQPKEGSRFDPKGPHGAAAFNRYWNDTYFTALEKIEAVAKKHGLSLAEIALRWARFDSALDASLGDNLIIGASSYKHLEENLRVLENGPLPEEVVKALDEAWENVKGVAYKSNNPYLDLVDNAESTEPGSAAAPANADADAPPPYAAESSSDAGPSTSTTLGSERRRRSSRSERRSEVPEPGSAGLPEGWLREWDPSSHNTFYVDTNVEPPRTTWHHPHDDPEYLASLPDRAAALSPDNTPGTASVKRSFSQKIKDKITGVEREQRAQERKEQFERQKAEYEAGIQQRASSMANQKNGPFLTTQRYQPPPLERNGSGNMGFGGAYGTGAGYGYSG
ncbi:aldo-keto reductase [Pseudohyphozyma bogoriensis]|nr:aldo-keto reductase [Pseudohyphozyma bogoriensis]